MSAGLEIVFLLMAFVACGVLLYLADLCERRLDGTAVPLAVTVEEPQAVA